VTLFLTLPIRPGRAKPGGHGERAERCLSWRKEEKPPPRFPTLGFRGLPGRACSFFTAPCLGQESSSKQRWLLVRPSFHRTHLLWGEIFPQQRPARLGRKAKSGWWTGEKHRQRVVHARVKPCRCGTPPLGWGHLAGTPSPPTVVSPGPPDHRRLSKSREGRSHGG